MKTTISNSRLSLLITAAGSSTRMGTGTKKEYLPLESGTVLSTCLKKFIKDFQIPLAVITVPKDGINEAKTAVECDSELSKIISTKKDFKLVFVEGAETRQASVFCGLEAIKKETQNFAPTESHFVMIHDGARPFVSEDVISRTLKAALATGAAFPGLEPVETQKEIDKDGIVTRHLKRSELISVQTPQIFDFERIFTAHQKAATDKSDCTDDTEIWGKYCGSCATVSGDEKNIKITYPSDYIAQKTEQTFTDKKMIRTGIGYDLHRLVQGRKLVIGGVEIPFEKGEDGHSDGDVLLHAITDALLGASALGDIGSFFPPEDEKWKNADSKMLLQTVWQKITGAGWTLENLDCVIKLEKPKFLPFREQTIEKIAEILSVEKERIFVKAKTYEKTDGWDSKIEAQCICLLSKN